MDDSSINFKYDLMHVDWIAKANNETGLLIDPNFWPKYSTVSDELSAMFSKSKSKVF